MNMSKRGVFKIIIWLLIGLSLVGSNSASIRTLSNPKNLSLYETLYFAVNTTSPPFDNVLVRYALAMATDRQSITNAMRDKRFTYFPSIGLVPQYEGYEPLKQLDVMIDGRKYDVLAYNPSSARDLLTKAGFLKGIGKNNQKLVVEMLVYTDDETDKLAAVVQKQWKENLGVDVKIVSKKWHDYLKAIDDQAFVGVALDGKSLLLSNATNLLSFATGQVSKKPLWFDEKFNKMLLEADRVGSSNKLDGNARYRECESYLLRAMPVIPLYSTAP